MHPRTMLDETAHICGRMGVPALLFCGCFIFAFVLWQQPAQTWGQGRAALAVRSAGFTDGGTIPRRFTCDGEGMSPEITWTAAPTETKSIALVMDDLDAPGGFTHWLAWNLAPELRELPEGASTRHAMPQGSNEGRNDFDVLGYGGPCPPHGSSHHYVFSLYAIDRRLELAAGASKKQLYAAMSGHVLVHGQLTGSYMRIRP